MKSENAQVGGSKREANSSVAAAGNKARVDALQAQDRINCCKTVIRCYSCCELGHYKKGCPKLAVEVQGPGPLIAWSLPATLFKCSPYCGADNS